MSDRSDSDLLALLRKQDTRHTGFDLLVRQYQEPLYRFLRRMLTDHDATQDVLQEVFIKVWRGIDGFRGDARLFSWLYRIAHNEALNHLRSLRRGLFVGHDAVVEQLTSTLDSSEHFNGEDIHRKLQRAVMRLPDKQRAVFTMKYFEELKYTEISTITGTSVGALKSSYHIAVKKVEEWLVTDQTKGGISLSKP